MILVSVASPAGVVLLFFGTNVGELHDDEESWPQNGNLILDGLVYRRLVLHAKATDEEIKQSEFGERLRLDPLNRIRWLRLQPNSEQYNAQPWMQLAKLLESTGDTDGAKHVMYEFHRQRSRRSLWRPLSFFYDQIEEKPLRVGWPIAFLWGLGSLVFWRAKRMGAMRPTAVAATNGAGASVAAAQISAPLHPAVYALENVLPVVRLGQDSAWEPDPKADGSLLPDWNWVGRVRRRAEQYALTRWMIRLDYKRLVLLRWVLILLGWGLALILAAAIGEQFKR
jgi:hypothetical protein